MKTLFGEETYRESCLEKGAAGVMGSQRAGCIPGDPSASGAAPVPSAQPMEPGWDPSALCVQCNQYRLFYLLFF